MQSDMSDQQKSTSVQPAAPKMDEQKLQKLKQFREANQIMKKQGLLYCQALKDI